MIKMLVAYTTEADEADQAIAEVLEQLNLEENSGNFTYLTQHPPRILLIEHPHDYPRIPSRHCSNSVGRVGSEVLPLDADSLRD